MEGGMSSFIYYQTDIDSVFLENIFPVSPTFHHLDNREKKDSTFIPKTCQRSQKCVINPEQ